jgi:molybdate transport system substrate-binding protein
MVNPKRLAAWAAALVLLVAVSLAPAIASGKLTVFAAASLKNALDAAALAWKAETKQAVTISYAASSALARQIEEGAPADVFLSADLDWMNYLRDRNLIRPGSETHLLGNDIVLIAPQDSAVETRIVAGFPLADLLGEGRLAVADVKAVPAGKYAKAALEKLGVWASVEGKLAMAENVRAALKLVALGEAPLGIVYRTDVRADETVKVIGTFPADTHPPIIYPVAITASSANREAEAFVSYLKSDKARVIFEEHGFTVLAPATTN